ncbi:sensor histidine kinase [Chitinophaga nivalis]|uniref:Histidine kinase n=1 Tax=Chitinophaga nivalis TaxID=2991709 RepID=A0ABT3IQZ1_9BACT|nr:histidine kinase [Chitinophaga nivalis]MCW3463913.1 histidine kinase [Chitinophaga nivalis]MCW3486397.1 histidine kinase [Chitinophaga nivalis]
MYRLKVTTLIKHFNGWLICLSIPLVFMVGHAGWPRLRMILSSPFFLLFFLSYFFLYYLHTYYLFPQLYLKKHWTKYFSVMASLLALFYYLQPFDLLFVYVLAPPGMQRQGFDIVSIFLWILTIALSVAIESTHRWHLTEQWALRAEAGKASAELAFLKAQINPHFLFNTLNNIYSLAVTKKENTAECLLKLSNILRYITDEVHQEMVPLQLEVSCIQDFIDLQQIRLGDNMQVHFNIHGNISHCNIIPLILMTFVENAFKYGTSNREQGTICISLNVTDHQLKFYCRNTCFHMKRPDNSSGIGIANSRHRLELLYPDKHVLNIDVTQEHYTVDLTLHH